MGQFIALLRGINVGGKNIVPMAELRELAKSVGWSNVQSYIQSGNLVFQADAPKSDDLTKAILSARGFAPRCLILSKSELNAIIKACPFESKTGKDVHVYFMDGKPHTEMDAFEILAAPTEKFALGENAFYLLAPDGIARSKLAASVEKLLGTTVTARNWNTVIKLQSSF